MTESPHLKAEGPEPPNVADILGEKHREAMAGLDAAIINQLKQQPITHIPENTTEIFFEDRGIVFTDDPRRIYSKQQLQPDSAEIERLRDDVYRIEGELTIQRSKLLTATAELNRVSNSLRLAEAKLVDAYQLIGRLVAYLDSIEWGTHDEWTRSQSLRERAHEYLTARNIIAT